MGTLASSEDPDEIHGLHCLLRLKQPSGTKISNILENCTCDP